MTDADLNQPATASSTFQVLIEAAPWRLALGLRILQLTDSRIVGLLPAEDENATTPGSTIQLLRIGETYRIQVDFEGRDLFANPYLFAELTEKNRTMLGLEVGFALSPAHQQVDEVADSW